MKTAQNAGKDSIDDNNQEDVIISYKCPNCGAPLIFSNKNQNMHCESCDSNFDIDKLEVQEESNLNWDDYKSDSGSGDWEDSEKESLNLMVCPSCGGEIVTDNNTAATRCPYCDNPTIITEKLKGIYKPDYIIPFKVDKSIAKQSIKDLCKGKFLLPKGFVDENRINDIAGVYVPFWLFSCDVNADYIFDAKRILKWSDSNYSYTQTDKYILARNGDIDFKNVPVDGSSKIDDAYMQAIEPFEYEDMVNFKMEYLSGYFADKYDIDDKSSAEAANERIKGSAKSILEETTVGYSFVNTLSSNIKMNNNKVRYALLPVWMLNTKYKGELYQLTMNGQTGKLIGNLPCDKKKYWVTFAAVSAVVMALGTIIAKFGGLI